MQFRLMDREVYYMRCAKIESKLDHFLDKSLSAEEMVIIEKHLLMCTKCNNELNAIRELKHIFNNDLIADVPASVSERICSDVYRALNQEENTSFNIFSWFFSMPQTVRLSYVTVILVGVIAGLFISNGIWFSNMKRNKYSRSDIVETIYTLEPFNSDADGLLYSLYVDMAITPSQVSLP